MTTVTISLPESPKRLVDRQLASRGSGNVSEFFRSLLREAQAKEEASKLELLLAEGLASGSDLAIVQEFWEDLRTEAARSNAQGPETGLKPELRLRRRPAFCLTPRESPLERWPPAKERPAIASALHG